MKNTLLKSVWLLAILFNGFCAYGSPLNLTYQGRILHSNGTPLEYANVSFLFEIANPTGTCVVYREQVDGINMTSSNGVFDVPIGTGTRLFPTAPVYKLSEAFENATTLNCYGGSTYTALADDNRVLKVQFHDGVGWRQINPPNVIRSVPYALSAFSAAKLGSFAATDFVLKTNLPAVPCGVGKVLTFDGVNFQCVTDSSGAGGTVTNIATGTGLSGGPITSNGTISLANTSVVGGNYGSATQVPSFTVDAQGRLTAANNIAIPSASTSTTGLLTSADWNAFNNKLGTATTFNGDVNGAYNSTSVDKIKGKALSLSSLTAENFLKYDGTNWVNTALSSANLTDSSSLIKVSQMPANCSAGQTLTFSSPTGAWICANITLSPGMIINGANEYVSLTLRNTSGAGGAAVDVESYDMANGYAPALHLTSRRGPLGAVTATQSGDTLGTVQFYGAGTSSADNEGASISATATQNFSATSSPTSLRFATTSAGSTTPALRMIIADTGDVGILGNVGIGKTNPSYKLDVVGDVNVTGNFKVNGVNIATGGGTVTNVTATAPLTSSGGTTPNITISQANATTNGFLSSTDWNTFNTKLGTTSTFAGDMSGTSSTTSVDKIKGKSVVPVAYAAGQTLRYDGTNWVNTVLSFSDLSGTGSVLTTSSVFAGDVSGTSSTMTLKNTGTAGTYTKVTTDAQGRVTSGTNLSATDIPALDWSKITTGKPTTLSGYGITDGVTNVTATAPLTSSGGTTPNIAISQANATTNGFLSSTDWNTFNTKLGTTSTFAGDVSGTSSTTSVDKIKGKAMVPVAYSAGQTLRYDGTNWVNAVLGFSDMSGTVTTAQLPTIPVSKGGTGTTTLTANRILASDGTGSAVTTFSCGIGQLVTFDSAGVMGCMSYSSSGIFANGGNSFGTAATLGTNDNFALNLETNGATRMTLLPSGNVGIGTSSPSAKLDVAGDFILGRSMHDTGVVTTQGVVFTSGDDLILVPAKDTTGFVRVKDENTAANISFYANGSGHIQSSGTSGSPAPLLLNENGGIVGVGTTTPQSGFALDVNGAILNRSSTFVHGVNSAAPAGGRVWQSVINTVDGGYYLGVRTDDTPTAGIVNTAPFKIFPNASTDSLALNAGNVGIGTANPQAKMDVAGDVRMGSSGVACGTANEGSVRYNSSSKQMEFCNGSVWQSVSSSNIAGFESGLVIRSSATTPLSKVDLAADEILMSNGISKVKATNVGVTNDTATTGANGLDAGSRTTNTWYYLYFISNGTTTASLSSTSSTAPTMPSGYTYKQRVGVFRTDNGGNILKFLQNKNLYTYSAAYQALSSGTSTSWTSVSLANLVPPEATHVTLQGYCSVPSTGVNGTCVVGDGSSNYMNTEAGYTTAGFWRQYNTGTVPLFTAQTTYYYNNTSGMQFWLHVQGFYLKW